MKLKFYMLLIFCFFSFQLFSQNAKLIGKVTEENGDGLISCNIVIDASKGLAAITDLEGLYEISLPGGEYIVLFKYAGYNEQSIKVTLAAGETKTLNPVLKQKQFIIDEVVITGSKYEKKLSEEIVSIEVMKSTVLNSQNVTDVQNGVQKIPGVTIADGQVNIRGGSGWSYGAGSRVAVLFDDLLVTTADADDVKWNMIPIENLDQLEVLKGAASAIYGTGALNGVINARMAYPNDAPFTKLQTYAGFYQGPTKTPSMKWWQGKPQYNFGANFADRRKIGQFDLTTGIAYNNDRGWLDSADTQEFRLSAKIRYRFKKIEGLNIGMNVVGFWSWGKTFFMWDSIGSKAYRPLVNTITLYDNNRYIVDPFINYIDKRNNKIAIRYRLLNSSNITSAGRGSISNRHILDLSYQRPFEISEKVKLNFVAGVGGRIDRIAPPRNLQDETPDSVRQQLIDSLGYYPTPYLYGNIPHNAYNASVYAQLDGKFFNRLNVSLGARWEYFNVDGQNSLKELTYPLFRVGLNYQAHLATFVRASFGQGFRYPSVAELFVTTKVGALDIFPNQNLKPEKGYSAEIGIKQGFKFDKNAVTTGYFDVAGFWNQYENMMEFIFGPFGQYSSFNSPGAGFSSQNIGSTRMLGVDAALGIQTYYRGLEFSILGGYTYVNSKALNWDKPITLFDFNGDTVKPSAAGGLFQGAYNGSNAPAGLDTTQYITYGMTSSSSFNTLKYRPIHQFKLIFNINHKRFDFNLDYQFIAYQENIDYSLVSPFFTDLVPVVFDINSFKALKQYWDNLESKNYRGDNIINLAVGYKPVDNLKLAFIIKNVANWEWMPRPGRFEQPRSFTLQLSYDLSNLNKKKSTGL